MKNFIAQSTLSMRQFELPGTVPVYCTEAILKIVKRPGDLLEISRSMSSEDQNREAAFTQPLFSSFCKVYTL